jgi:hypothetical protein
MSVDLKNLSAEQQVVWNTVCQTLEALKTARKFAPDVCLAQQARDLGVQMERIEQLAAKDPVS